MRTYTKAEGGVAASRSRNIMARLMPVVATARRRVAAWSAVARGRAELARLSDRDLQDMGISRAAATAELRKPFWRE